MGDEERKNLDWIPRPVCSQWRTHPISRAGDGFRQNKVTELSNPKIVFLSIFSLLNIKKQISV